MILVVGATGVVGGMITSRLLERGDEVRILVRRNSPSEQLAREGRATSAEEWIAAGASPAYGDMRDRASLDAALEGVRAVVSTANSVGRGGDDNVRTVDLEGNRNLIEAARDAGVGRFVFISALGAAVESPVPFLQAKGQSEATLLESGMEYAILAPNPYMEVWVAVVVGMPALQGRPVVLVEEGRRRHSFVSNRHVDVRLGHQDGEGLPHLRRHADEARDVRAGAGRTPAYITFATTVRVSTGRYPRPASRPFLCPLAGTEQEKIVYFGEAAHLPGRVRCQI